MDREVGLLHSTRLYFWVDAVSPWNLHRTHNTNSTPWCSVHAQSPPPLSIYTRIYYSNEMRPEISTDTPFLQAVASLGNATESDPETQLYPAFAPLDGWDVVLRKSRYYAGDGNSLEEILRGQKIRTVILVSRTFSSLSRGRSAN